MKKYKYITIQCAGKISQRPYYAIINNKSEDRLGDLYYYPPWKQYIAVFKEDCVFNYSCLRDIADFLENHAGKD